MYDTTEGPLSDLSNVASFKSQIRNRNGTKDRDGHLVHALVADVTVTKSDLASTITQSLTLDEVNALFEGVYAIDLVATNVDGTNESYLDPEPIRVVNHPTVL